MFLDWFISFQSPRMVIHVAGYLKNEGWGPWLRHQHYRSAKHFNLPAFNKLGFDLHVLSSFPAPMSDAATVTHTLRYWFSVIAQLPGQRKVVEPKGGKSEELKVFEQMFLASCKTKRVSQNARLSCNNAVERVCGRYREHEPPWKQQTAADWKPAGVNVLVAGTGG